MRKVIKLKCNFRHLLFEKCDGRIASKCANILIFLEKFFVSTMMRKEIMEIQAGKLKLSQQKRLNAEKSFFLHGQRRG